jgi:hypothetical protein
MNAGMLYAWRERENKKELRVRACFMLARVCTPFSPIRERERKRERLRKRERERERERDVEYVQNCYF